MSRRSGACLRCCLVIFAVVSALCVSGPALYFKFKKGLKLKGALAASCPPCVCNCAPPQSLFQIVPASQPQPYMGTRQVYEEKLRRGNLHHDPTIKPGLGSPRCPRCLSLLNPSQENSEWKITQVLHDATAVAGSGIGGMLSVVHGFNTGIPYVQKHVKGKKWLPFVIGLPPLLMFSAAGAAFGGYALPKFTQLTVTAYYTASSASHYGISLLTRHIEENHGSSRIQHKEL